MRRLPRFTRMTDRLDTSRIAAATTVAAGLGVGLAAVFLQHAQGQGHVGPTSATLDEVFSALLGACIGLALGSAFCSLAIRRGPPLLSGLLAAVAAYVLVLVPLLIATDDVSLAEDLSLGGFVVLAVLLVLVAAFALLGAAAGGLLSSLIHRDRRERPRQA